MQLAGHMKLPWEDPRSTRTSCLDDVMISYLYVMTVVMTGGTYMDGWMITARAIIIGNRVFILER